LRPIPGLLRRAHSRHNRQTIRGVDRAVEDTVIFFGDKSDSGSSEKGLRPARAERQRREEDEKYTSDDEREGQADITRSVNR